MDIRCESRNGLLAPKRLPDNEAMDVMTLREHKSQELPRVGDTYAIPLPSGGYGAIRVLRVSQQEDRPSTLVAVTPWLGDDPPSLAEPKLREIVLRRRGKFGGRPAISWYTGMPPASFVPLGAIAPTTEELALDPNGEYGGEWGSNMAQDALLEAKENASGAIQQSRRKLADVDRISGVMLPDDFWSKISLIDWNRNNDVEKVEPLVEHLAALPPSAIAGFHRQLCEHLSRLNDARFARQLGIVDPDSGETLSVDHFLDVRCAVIANGREFYDAVLADPTKMPTNVEFEPLLDTAEAAYRRRTGRTPVFLGAKEC
jgi:hypothetical protein